MSWLRRVPDSARSSNCVLGTFIVLLFVRLIVDWIQMFARSWTPRGPVLVILEGIYTVTDPPVSALRKMIPPLRLGGVAIDLSFVALLLICYILLSLNRAILLAGFGVVLGSRRLRHQIAAFEVWLP